MDPQQYATATPPKRESKTIRHTKNPSLRDVMLGKKVTKKLPDNFFEKVLDLELKLKREFTMASLQELVNLYSVRNIL